MKTHNSKALEAADALARAIQSSAEWHEVVSAQQAAKRDIRFAKMLARQEELSRAERSAQAGGRGLGGREPVEMIALPSRPQGHDLNVRCDPSLPTQLCPDLLAIG